MLDTLYHRKISAFCGNGKHFLSADLNTKFSANEGERKFQFFPLGSLFLRACRKFASFCSCLANFMHFFVKDSYRFCCSDHIFATQIHTSTHLSKIFHSFFLLFTSRRLSFYYFFLGCRKKFNTLLWIKIIFFFLRERYKDSSKSMILDSCLSKISLRFSLESFHVDENWRIKCLHVLIRRSICKTEEEKFRRRN